MGPDGRSGPGRSAGGRSRPARLTAVAVAVILVGPSCSRDAGKPVALDPGKVASVVVGRSSRADVFAALGRPGRTERSARGDAWIYEAKAGAPGAHNLMSGVAAASGVIGAIVPFAGLVGSGVSLAGEALGGGATPEPEAASLAVLFKDDGVVLDCVYSSTAPPAGVSGEAPGASKPVDCQRPRESGRGP